MARNNVIIVGGGVAGLALSQALKVAGIHSTIFEERTKEACLNHGVGGGIGLWGPAQEALRTLGLLQELERKGEMMACAGYKSRGKWLVRPGGYSYLTSCLVVERHDLMSSLYSRMCEDQIVFGKKFERFESNDTGVQVTFSGGETLHGSLLVGVDGIHSRVRAQAFNNMGAPEFAGYRYWRAVVPWSRFSSSQPAPFEAWGTGKRFGLVPMRGGKVFWFAVLNDNAVVHPKETNINHMLLDMFHQDNEFEPLCLQAIESTLPNEIIETPIMQLPLHSSQKLPAYVDADQNVVLAGDAAHAMAPNLAQGAGLALEDVLQLASCLRRYDQRVALSRYDHTRRRRVVVPQHLARAVNFVGSLGTPWSTYRDISCSLLPTGLKTPLFDRLHQFTVGWSYTAPNIGQGLYARVLGPVAFRELPEAQQAFHRGEKNVTCSGIFDVKVGKSVLARAMSVVSGLPKQSISTAKMSLDIQRDRNGCEFWNRCFSGQTARETFRSVQWCESNTLVEAAGPVAFVFELVPKPGGFDHVLKHVRLRGTSMPLPRFVWPRISATTRSHSDQNGWNASIVVRCPEPLAFLFDPDEIILQYEGVVSFPISADNHFVCEDRENK